MQVQCRIWSHLGKSNMQYQENVNQQWQTTVDQLKKGAHHVDTMSALSTGQRTKTFTFHCHKIVTILSTITLKHYPPLGVVFNVILSILSWYICVQFWLFILSSYYFLLYSTKQTVTTYGDLQPACNV